LYLIHIYTYFSCLSVSLCRSFWISTRLNWLSGIIIWLNFFIIIRFLIHTSLFSSRGLHFCDLRDSRLNFSHFFIEFSMYYPEEKPLILTEICRYFCWLLVVEAICYDSLSYLYASANHFPNCNWCYSSMMTDSISKKKSDQNGFSRNIYVWPSKETPKFM